MRFLNLVLLVFLLASGIAAQTSSIYPDAPDVAVINHSWHATARDRRMEADPLGPSSEHRHEENYRKYIEETNAGGSPVDIIDRPEVWRNVPRSAPSVKYVFEATISNTGTKTIRRLIWEYVFLDRTTKREVGYRPFLSQESIRPGQSKKLVGTVFKYPASAAEGAKAIQKMRGTYIEQVFIRSIEYDDNTSWRRPRK